MTELLDVITLSVSKEKSSYCDRLDHRCCCCRAKNLMQPLTDERQYRMRFSCFKRNNKSEL